MPDFSIGVDLGGTNLRIAAISREGKLLEKVTLPAKVSRGPDPVIQEMCSSILQLCGKYRHLGKFLGAGLGIPGIIDLPTGTLRKCANLPSFEGYPVRAEIERLLCAPAVLENDANVAALGEQWLGAARGVANAAVITLGTGIGGGLVLGGKIWHGMNGMAGEFGHVTVEPEGPECGCGSRGCAERYASASGLVRMARQAIAAGEAPSLAKAAASETGLDAQSLYALAMQGDEAARRIFQLFGRYLGILLAGMVNGLNLEMYVIGGGVARAWDAFAPGMFEELRRRSVVYAATAPEGPFAAESTITPGSLPAVASAARRETIVTRALLGSDAGLYGAARVSAMAGRDSPGNSGEASPIAGNSDQLQ
jgi:glucokinase